MKNSLILRTLFVAIVSGALSFFAPLMGDDSTDLLNKALDLVHQAWNPAGDAPSNDQRSNLLTQALKLAQDSPDHHVRRHRVQAILDIKAALDVLKDGDPDNKATGYIRDADSELRTALSIAG